MNHIILVTPLNGFNELKNIAPRERRFKAQAVTLHVFKRVKYVKCMYTSIICKPAASRRQNMGG